MALAEYLKNSSTELHQTYVSFRQSYVEVLEIKRLKIDHSLVATVTNSWEP